MLNTTNTEFLPNELWFTDQNSKSLEIEDNVRGPSIKDVHTLGVDRGSAKVDKCRQGKGGD